jgi:ketosteroid isomerase-like protein
VASAALTTLRRGIDAWNRRDYDAALSTMREDIVWRTGGGIPDLESAYRGHDGVRRFFEEFVDPWEEISVAIDEVVDERDDQVLVVVRFQARGRGDIEVDGRFFQLYRFDDEGLLYDFAAFVESDEDLARAAAGLDDG